MSTKQWVREYRRAVQKCGGKVLSITLNGHVRIVVGSGKRRKMFIASSTPSDNRAMQNFRSQVKRWIAGGT